MAFRAVNASRQAFHDWKVRVDAGPTDTGPTDTEQAEAVLVDQIREIHIEHDGIYGEPRMTAELARRGVIVNHKRVERLIRVNNIVGVHKPAKVTTTIPAEDRS